MCIDLLACGTVEETNEADQARSATYRYRARPITPGQGSRLIDDSVVLVDSLAIVITIRRHLD